MCYKYSTLLLRTSVLRRDSTFDCQAEAYFLDRFCKSLPNTSQRSPPVATLLPGSPFFLSWAGTVRQRSSFKRPASQCGHILASPTSHSVAVHFPNVKAHPFACGRKTISASVPRLIFSWCRSCSPAKLLSFNGYHNSRRECPPRCSGKSCMSSFTEGVLNYNAPRGEVTTRPENNYPLRGEHKSLRAR